MADADPHDRRHLPGRFGKHHRIGQRQAMVRFVLAMMGAHRIGHGQPIAEDRMQFGDQCAR